MTWNRVGDEVLTLEVKALKKEILRLRKAVVQLHKDVAALKGRSARKVPTRGAPGVRGPVAAK
jgi:hypothetical protein